MPNKIGILSESLDRPEKYLFGIFLYPRTKKRSQRYLAFNILNDTGQVGSRSALRDKNRL